ncbi:MAG: glycosyltransferase family 4 protein [Deltaproteobacteria bacterium]|nr:glycosyltransferase family 4 protein [Deltaproteobacteria bacterium]
MKILALQSTSIFEQYGGVEYYLDDLLRSLGNLEGAENVASLVPERNSFTREPDGSYQVIPVPMTGRGWRRRFENRVPLLLFRQAFSLGRRMRPDLILCGHVSLGPLALLLSKLLGCRFVTVVYGIDAWGNLYPHDEWCLKQASALLSISHWTKQILVGRGYDEKRIHITHPVVAPDLTHEGRSATHRDPFTLLTVSRLDASERYKGHDDTLQALAQLKSRGARFRYLIQGSGDDLERLEKRARDLGLTESVVFVGATHDRNELRALYSQADVFIMPSRFGRWGNRWRGEGFGIVYAEAGALGVPSIAYRCGGATDIIGHGKTGLLVEPNNIAELSHSILYCMDNPEVVQNLGENARKRVRSHFTRDQMKSSAEDFLRALRK